MNVCSYGFQVFSRLCVGYSVGFGYSLSEGNDIQEWWGLRFIVVKVSVPWYIDRCLSPAGCRFENQCWTLIQDVGPDYFDNLLFGHAIEPLHGMVSCLLDYNPTDERIMNMQLSHGILIRQRQCCQATYIKRRNPPPMADTAAIIHSDLSPVGSVIMKAFTW